METARMRMRVDYMSQIRRFVAGTHLEGTWLGGAGGQERSMFDMLLSQVL
jgi:hypothetical protein